MSVAPTRLAFAPAQKSKSKARIALIGPSGSGKTFTALGIASGLGERIAVIDTEHGSASKYADRFTFDVLDLEHHDPLTYVKAIQAAEGAGYDVVIIDSLSHAWAGSGGALEQVDAAAKRSKGNSYVAWRDVTPKHNAMIEAMVGCKAHLVVTMRSKTAYELQKDDKTGKVSPVKIGLAPVQRDGMEYEFDVVADIDLDHNLIVSKTRMSDLDGLVEHKPDAVLGKRIADWLSDGVERAPRPAAPAMPEMVIPAGGDDTDAPDAPPAKPLRSGQRDDWEPESWGAHILVAEETGKVGAFIGKTGILGQVEKIRAKGRRDAARTLAQQAALRVIAGAAKQGTIPADHLSAVLDVIDGMLPDVAPAEHAAAHDALTRAIEGADSGVQG